MAGNYIKIDRKITEWEWYKNTNTKIVFFHCLLKANWKDTKFEGRVIKRGSFVTSVKQLAKELEISQQSTRTALEHLKSTNELTIETTNRYSVITVNNYCLYQDINNQANNQLTNNQQTTNKQKDEKEERTKEVKEDYINREEVKNNKYIYINNNNKEVVVKVINYLNNKCNTHYRATSKNTQKHINARLEEGYEEEDFYTVIDKKYAEWSGTEMEKFLCPDTLFGTKFEKYLNQNIVKQMNMYEEVDSWT